MNGEEKPVSPKLVPDASDMTGKPNRRINLRPVQRLIFQRDNFRCGYCGQNGDGVRLGIDHILPLHKGGDHSSTNLISACASCNWKKGRRILSDPPLVSAIPEVDRLIKENYNRWVLTQYRDGWYVPKNPLLRPRKTWTVSMPLSLYEKLEEFGQSIYPSLTVSQILKHFVVPGLADWIDNWLAVHKPKDGSKVPIENVRMFPLILRERKVERRP